MTQHAMGSLVEMLGVEKGLTVMNFFTAMENPEMVQRQLKGLSNGDLKAVTSVPPNLGILREDC